MSDTGVATATLSVVAFYICPNCKERSIDTDGLDSLLDSQAVGCHHCGFGFLFELTGYPEGELMGNDVVERLGLSGYDDGKNPVALALEWGVRRMGEKLVLVTRSGQDKSVTADIFPAYDADGGLLVALTPR